MALQSFHIFSELPPELRLMVWEAALRPSDATRGALHHFYIWNHKNHSLPTPEKPPGLAILNYSHIDNIPAECQITAVPFCQHAHRTPLGREGTCSAYFWDCGMWAACQESRHVIDRRFRVRDWKCLAGELLKKQLKICPRSLKSAWLSDEHRLNVSTVVMPDIAGQTFPVATQPMKDLYVLHLGDFRNDADEPTGLGYLIQLGRFIRVLFNDLALSPMAEGFPTVTNIGFEFDYTWWDGFRAGERRRHRHPWLNRTPLGLLTNMLARCATKEINIRFWLIDRETKQYPLVETRRWAETPHQVFYDYNQEYVEQDVAANNFHDHYNASRMVCFLRNIQWNIFRQPHEEPFEVLDLVGVLVPRNRSKTIE
ncbi:hypothetical protein NW762_004110 [Fusarium torreyae]|uniref:2EXR domain-containing protein n=1 Tax=Fusarium torreyae TaxID=1237075 RepID=A0A9W8S8C7_9HYPO|nr:hypothetical protein NW762_004110 [Fusarium torreyae]